MFGAVCGNSGVYLGIVGFCFGGGAAMRLSSGGVFSACGGVHASGMGSPGGEDMIKRTRCPIMLLQAGGDPLLKPVHDVIKEMDDKSVIKTHSVLRTYWDQNHGWCGAGGDRKEDPRVCAAVESALATMIKFFDRTLAPGLSSYVIPS